MRIGHLVTRAFQRSQRGFISRNFASWSSILKDTPGNRPVWSEEWKKLGLGAELVDGTFPSHLFFVQIGFGVDQHGQDDATKAAIRAVRNAIEFNSIPGVISHLPGGRKEMLIHVKLGVPLAAENESKSPLFVDHLQVAKVFPYGKLLPLQVVVGGLSFHTGRVVEELGDENDVGICVTACVSLGYGQGEDGHQMYSTKDGY